jgi:hypothetical protein
VTPPAAAAARAPESAAMTPNQLVFPIPVHRPRISTGRCSRTSRSSPRRSRRAAVSSRSQSAGAESATSWCSASGVGAPLGKSLQDLCKLFGVNAKTLAQKAIEEVGVAAVEPAKKPAAAAKKKGAGRG